MDVKVKGRLTSFRRSQHKVFHTTTLVRRRCNKIVMLKDEEGTWVDDAEKLKDLALGIMPNFLCLRTMLVGS